MEEWNSAWLSRCSWGDRPLVDLYVELAGFSGRCTGVSLPLRVVPWSTGLPSSWVLPSGSYQERTRELGSFGMPHHPRGYVSNFVVRLASSWCAPGRSGTPSRQSRGKWLTMNRVPLQTRIEQGTWTRNNLLFCEATEIWGVATPA